jgi:hypothetical protein
VSATRCDTPIKLPATLALAGHLDHLPELLDPPGPLSADGTRELHYERCGDVGVPTFDFHTGAMSTAQCRRLAAALRRAVAADTRVLVLRGGETFSNGTLLNVIEAAAGPEAEAWRNINAIDDVCASRSSPAPSSWSWRRWPAGARRDVRRHLRRPARLPARTAGVRLEAATQRRPRPDRDGCTSPGGALRTPGWLSRRPTAVLGYAAGRGVHRARPTTDSGGRR